jgi:hypothetical protein
MTYSFVSVDTPFFSQPHLGFFPIVIVTVFIEKFSIMLTEDGPLNTFKSLAGTFLISVLSYIVYSIRSLEVFVFTNPEILFIVMGFLVLIGKYKGYRLSEFLRFRDLVKQLKNKKN